MAETTLAPRPNGSATTLAALKARTQGLPPETPLSFFSAGGLDLMQRAAHLLANSTLVPESYQLQKVDKKTGQVAENKNAISNCVLALNMAQRLGADPLMIMQHLYIVDGHPGWSSQFVISAINSCGRYSPLRFDIQDAGEQEVEYEVVTGWERGYSGKSVPKKEKRKEKIRNKTCAAWAVEKATGEKLEGPSVSMEMAVKEGWYQKTGSKWQSMPDVMLRYRAASFFGKLYAPELLMGLQTAEEESDATITIEPAQDGVFEMTVAEAGEQEAQPEKLEKKRRHRARAASGPTGEEQAPGSEDKAPFQDGQAQGEEAPEYDGDCGNAPAAADSAYSRPEYERFECVKEREDGAHRIVGPSDCEYCDDKHGCPQWDGPDRKRDGSPALLAGCGKKGVRYPD